MRELMVLNERTCSNEYLQVQVQSQDTCTYLARLSPHFNPVEMSGRDAMPGLTIFEGWWPKRYRRERERHVDLTLPPR